MHTVVGAGAASGSMDASNLLKPALARGQLRCIGATTINEYRKYIEKDKALERRFQQVYIGEPSPEDTVSILRGLKPRYELHHGVRIRDEALLAAAKLSSRYLPDRFLPDKGEFTNMRAGGRWWCSSSTACFRRTAPILPESRSLPLDPSSHRPDRRGVCQAQK